MTKSPDQDKSNNREKTHYQENLPELELGKATQYPEQYDPSQLQPVGRFINRSLLNVDTLPFDGYDTWNGYEFSWLNNKGKPQLALLRCDVPATSTNIIESKSFKLYLNSFNQSRFDKVDEVRNCLIRDLSHCAEAPVTVALFPVDALTDWQIESLPGECIDSLDVTIEHYQPTPELLQVETDEVVSEKLHSHLLKSNCLITNQPDWGSVYIHYEGRKIDHASLLKYIVSFRLHNEFHEQCVERIFCDILQQCQPQNLTVMARYTRRGGLDINPFRSNFETDIPCFRTVRQ